MAHADSFRINIDIAYMHRLTARILDVSNAFQNKNVHIHEIVCVSPPPYYLDWFEKSYPNVPLNRDNVPFCLQCMYGIQEQNHLEDNRIDSLMQWSKLLSIRGEQFHHAIYINFFSDVTVSYLIVSTDDVLNTTNNDSLVASSRSRSTN